MYVQKLESKNSFYSVFFLTTIFFQKVYTSFMYFIYFAQKDEMKKIAGRMDRTIPKWFKYRDNIHMA
jgi:hypothetical protein